MKTYEVCVGVNVRRYYKIEVQADDPETANAAALGIAENDPDQLELCADQDDQWANDPDFATVGDPEELT